MKIKIFSWAVRISRVSSDRRAYARAYYHKNSKRINAYNKQWRQAKRDKLKIGRLY